MSFKKTLITSCLKNTYTHDWPRNTNGSGGWSSRSTIRGRRGGGGGGVGWWLGGGGGGGGGGEVSEVEEKEWLV